MAFVLAAVNPANPVIPTAMGQSGGALGYSAQNSNTNGLSYGYLGVGFDAYGNFSNKYEGSGCTDPPNISGPMAGEVVVRGPGNGTVGYCALQSSAGNTTAAVPGGTVTYTITVTDTGQTPYAGAAVTDSLDGVLGDAGGYNSDAAATVTDGTGTAGSLSYASPDLTWAGDLTVGETVTITYSVTVHNPDTGGKLMLNFVTSSDPGPSCPFDSPSPGCTVSIPVLTPALALTKTASTTTTTPGSTVGYTITVQDTGQTPRAPPSPTTSAASWPTPPTTTTPPPPPPPPPAPPAPSATPAPP